jgi:hypothetical protein
MSAANDERLGAMISAGYERHASGAAMPTAKKAIAQLWGMAQICVK